MASSALTTPSVWDISFVEDGGLETSEDLYIVIKSIFPQGNVEITKRDDITYRVKLPYCTKLTSLKTKFHEYENAVTIVSAGADLSVDQTKRLAELKRKISKKHNDPRLQQNVEVKIRKIASHIAYENLVTLPTYLTKGSSGVDLHAHVPGEFNKIYLYPGQRHPVPTGLQIEIPMGFEGQIRSKPGMEVLYGVGVLNAPITLDSNIRDNDNMIYVTLINHGDRVFEIRDNMKIAILVLSRVEKITWNVVRKSKARLTQIDTIDLSSDEDESGPDEVVVV